MLTVTAKFSGIQELETIMLRQLSKEQQSEILNEALDASAEIVKGEMVKTAPKHTGALRAAIRKIKHKAKPGKAKYSVEVGQGMFKGDEYYAGFQEWGWHLGKRQSRKKGHKDTRKWFVPPHAGYAEKALTIRGDAVNQVAEDIIVQRVREKFGND